MLVKTFSKTSFQDDIAKGKIGEVIFIEDFLNFLHINYQDVTGIQGFQIIDSDFLAKIGRYEIKANYKDDKYLIIEEFTNANEQLSPKSLGWFYKSKADILVFISKETRAMILLPFTDEFKSHYESIKEEFELRMNKISQHNGRMWQSAFRRIPLQKLNGFFAYYKKVI
jgi:hypothetical protein